MKRVDDQGAKRDSIQQGVQGVEIGLRLTSILARSPRPMTLGELSAESGLLPSKTHRYLVSLVRGGLVTQSFRDQRYKLGGGAVFLGLSAQNLIDEYQLLNDAIEVLHARTGHAVAVSTWGTYGPVVIRQVEPPNQPVIIVARLGANVPLLNTAAGHLFAAFTPPDIAGPVIAREFASKPVVASSGKAITRRVFNNMVDKARDQKMAAVDGVYRAGYRTVAAPVFGTQGDLLFVISLITMSSDADISTGGELARLLGECATYIEAGLGVHPPQDKEL